MGHPTAVFRSLAEEIEGTGLASTAGYHDLSRIYIMGGRAGDRFVMAHEMIHDRLLRETAYGATQYAFREAMRATAADSAVSKRLKLWVELLIAKSLSTHESAATYLSIKDFPVEVHGQLLAMLPQAYKGYYDLLATVVDPLFPSAFVQFAIAKVIVETAMGPPICKRLLTWTPEWGLHIDESEAPDDRLLDLLAMIRVQGRELAAFLHESIRKSEGRWPATLDPDRDQSWKAADETTVSAANDLMFAAFREWVYSNARAFWPIAGSDDWLRDAMSLQERLAHFGGPTGGSSYRFTKRVNIKQFDLIEAIQHGRARIQLQNPSYASAPRLDQSAGMREVFVEAPGVRSFITKELRSSGSDTDWYMIIGGGKTEQYQITSVPESAFYKALTARNRWALLGGPVPAIDSITIGVESGDEEYFAELYNGFIRSLIVNDRIMFDENVVWYLGGDFFWWYDLLVAADPRVEFSLFFSSRFYDLYGGAKSFDEIVAILKTTVDANTDNGPQWIALRSKAIFGICFHILPAGTPEGFGGIFQQEMANGTLHRMDKPEAERAGERLVAANRVVSSCWAST